MFFSPSAGSHSQTPRKLRKGPSAYIITVESMFVNIFPVKSSLDKVVITLLFFTLTTNAVVSTRTSVSLLPLSAAISTDRKSVV